MSTLYFLRQPFTNDPKDTWRIASGRAFDFMPEADRMAVVPAASLADAQAEIARLRGALERLADCAQRCDSWESFPQDELDAAYAAISK